MIIIGVDPGSKRIGYGVIRLHKGDTTYLTAGILSPRSNNHSSALYEIYQHFTRLIKRYHPAAVAIEKFHFVKNQTTSVHIAEARGVITLSTRLHDTLLYEHSPTEVKSALTGYGFADKKSVAKMVEHILKMRHRRLLDDATDALAVALVASRHMQFDRLKQ